jgi:GNAT superfamily N-acetyltransferase
MDSVEKDFWTDQYPENFHLNLLCTLPRYRRRGAGTALTRWGINAARDEGAIVAVESSPMGEPLYHSLGFKLMAKRTVKVDDEEEELLVRIMVCVPEPEGAAAAVPRECGGGMRVRGGG